MSTGVSRTKFWGSRTGYVIGWASYRIKIPAPLSKVMKNFETGTRGCLSKPRTLCDCTGCKPLRPPWVSNRSQSGGLAIAPVVLSSPVAPPPRAGWLLSVALLLLLLLLLTAGVLILVKFFGPQSFNSSKLRFIFFSPVKSSLGYH